MLYTMIIAIAIVIDYISQCHRYVNASWSKEWEGKKKYFTNDCSIWEILLFYNRNDKVCINAQIVEYQ